MANDKSLEKTAPVSRMVSFQARLRARFETIKAIGERYKALTAEEVERASFHAGGQTKVSAPGQSAMMDPEDALATHGVGLLYGPTVGATVIGLIGTQARASKQGPVKLRGGVIEAGQLQESLDSFLA